MITELFTRLFLRDPSDMRIDVIMRHATLILSIVTILSLDLILLLGAVEKDPGSIRPVLNGLVAVIDLSLVSSSCLLGFLFLRRRSSVLAAVFFLNIVIFVVAFILRSSGVVFPPVMLFLADIYWLNVYLICLSWKFNTLFRSL